MSGCLFCNNNPNGCKYCNPLNAPDWFSTGPTAVESHKQHISVGLHPMGLPLLKQRDGRKRCGNCRYLITKERSKKYFKCGKSKMTDGPATDVRKKWWGCILWEPGENYDDNDDVQRGNSSE